MLAYAVNHENIAIIANFNGQAIVHPDQEDVTHYVIVNTVEMTAVETVTKEEFENKYLVKKTINEALGRFIVEKK